LPIPIVGWPSIHSETPDHLGMNVDPSQLVEWMQYPASSIVAIQVYGVVQLTPRETLEVIRRLKTAIARLTDCQMANVAAPLAVEGSGGGSPKTFLAYNLSTIAADILKRQRCVSTDAIAFFAYDFTPSIPTLLFGLRGFTENDANQLQTIVRNTFLSQKFRSFSLALAHVNPEFRGLTDEAIVNSIIRTIKVTTLEEDGAIIAHVYCKSPTALPDLWCLWRDVLGSAEYFSSLYGRGTRAQACICSGCHGADHPRSRCPFASLLGWN
ncbi:hypothetical protein LXA43DRAFT_850737, partial [Ganoderma leucocontextum]